MRREINTKLFGFITASSVTLALLAAALVAALATVLSVTAMASDNWFVFDGASQQRYNIRLSPNWLCEGSTCGAFPPSDATDLCRPASEIAHRQRGISAALVMGFLSLFACCVAVTHAATDVQWVEEYLRSTEAGTTIDRITEVKRLCRRSAVLVQGSVVAALLGLVLTSVGVGLFRTSVDTYYNCGSSVCTLFFTTGSTSVCAMGAGYGLGVASCVMAAATLVLLAASLRLVLERLGELSAASASRAVEVEENADAQFQAELMAANALRMLREEEKRQAALAAQQNPRGTVAPTSGVGMFRARSATEPLANTNATTTGAGFVSDLNDRRSQPAVATAATNPIGPGTGGGGGQASPMPKKQRPPPMTSSDDVWEFDGDAALFFSATRKLFYDPQSEQYYDPATEMWYDPEGERWYRLEGS